MALKITNNAVSRLTGSLGTGDLTFSITPGDGVKFPTLGVGDWHPLTLIRADGFLEVVRATARTADTFTVSRAQDGTTALAFSAGDRVELRFTKGMFDEFPPGDDTVSAAKLQTDSVITAKIAALAVTAAKLAADAVTTVKVLANAITLAKLQQIATDKLLGRSTAGTGDVELIDCPAAGRSLIAANSTAAQLAVLGITNSLLPTGMPGYIFGSTAPDGWVARIGQTIGSATSGATERAHADTEALFTKIWGETTNADYPIQNSSGAATTRGVSAAADFAADKRMPLPDGRDMFDVGLSGSTTLGVSIAQSGGLVEIGTDVGTGNEPPYSLAVPEDGTWSDYISTGDAASASNQKARFRNSTTLRPPRTPYLPIIKL